MSDLMSNPMSIAFQCPNSIGANPEDKINKSPKELDFIPTVSSFKYISILLSNGGQHEIQKLIRESDPNKIGLVKIFTLGWTIHITDIEYAKSLLSESEHTIPKFELPPKIPFSIVFGNGILISNGDHWVRQRKIASPAFNRVLCPDIATECTNEFIMLLNKWIDTPVDVLSLTKRLTIQILGKLAFAYDMKALDSLEERPYFLNLFDKIFKHANSPLFIIFPFMNSLPFERNIEFSSLVKEFDDFIFKIIEQRRLKMSKAKNENENTDLLAGILESANHEEYNYTNKELRDKPKISNINNYGITSSLSTSKLISTSNPNIWNDADKFIPERFINPTKETKNNWIPFSIGPRNCLGRNFSMMEQKVVIALTLLNFEILLPPNAQHLDEIPLKKTFVLQPKKIDLIFSKLK
ncbi:cytochrome P450 [Gigaspora rosea]|uniref:Cytochrome P450 n=1 Tax=Gigaspora rosea TaxID=44941 RepID=A0A397W504_9GLOM|nr:cytochrome P450 [Gigaspora rosea]